MGGIAIHYLAKTKLGIKTYENLSELHTQTNVPSCIKSVVIQSVITECVYFVITINMDWMPPTDASPSNLALPPTPQAK